MLRSARSALFVLLAALLPLSLAQEVKLAFMGPLTGGAAFIGQEALGFTQVVVDAFNERTGLDVEVVEGDTEINADTGRIVAERLAADDAVVVVVGPMGSQVCEATQEIFQDANLAQLTQSCTRTDLTSFGYETFFRPIPNDADQSRTIADFWLDELTVDSAYLVDDQSSYSVGLNDEVEDLMFDAGVTEIGRSSVPQDATDLTSVATAAIASGADVVFFPNQIASQGAALSVALAQQGFEGVLFMPDGGFNQEWVDIAGQAAEGTYVTFFAPDPNQVESMQPYNEAYRAQYTDQFGAFGGASALATYVALQAVEMCADAGSLTRDCVVDELSSIDLDTTPLGVPVTFDDDNQAVNSSFFLFQVQDGEFVLLDEAN